MKKGSHTYIMQLLACLHFLPHPAVFAQPAHRVHAIRNQGTPHKRRIRGHGLVKPNEKEINWRTSNAFRWNSLDVLHSIHLPCLECSYPCTNLQHPHAPARPWFRCCRQVEQVDLDSRARLLGQFSLSPPARPPPSLSWDKRSETEQPSS